MASNRERQCLTSSAYTTKPPSKRVAKHQQMAPQEEKPARPQALPPPTLLPPPMPVLPPLHQQHPRLWLSQGAAAVS
ncbi:hypothetical protein DUNSADRAFT_2187 [Dunaliella salina]|uniref:Encoded protein n=1 Tax=Dunaliella salina TaxID=3046 RepID=A0ABQ7GW05_DUNSA|nr:hypothetical protein DUNSADRAFT_2187 [Dunaliella salina]|eukprot:KAF5838802.1 hypothetical protein DUNSADRAFT_2187 [Dunaliella salina]